MPRPLAVTMLALAVSGMMGYTSNLSGQIRLPELRSEAVTY